MNNTKVVSLSDEEITALAGQAIDAARALPENKVSEGWSRLDELCLPIMNALGVDQGDLAAYYWDGYEDQFDVRLTVERYIRAEIAGNVREIEAVEAEKDEMSLSVKQGETMTRNDVAQSVWRVERAGGERGDGLIYSLQSVCGVPFESSHMIVLKHETNDQSTWRTVAHDPSAKHTQYFANEGDNGRLAFEWVVQDALRSAKESR